MPTFDLSAILAALCPPIPNALRRATYCDARFASAMSRVPRLRRIEARAGWWGRRRARRVLAETFAAAGAWLDESEGRIYRARFTL